MSEQNTEFLKKVNILTKVDVCSELKALNEKKYKSLKSDASRIESGIEFLINQVHDQLGDKADKIFVEYSFVASTLDPEDPDKLQCCSFIISKDDNGSFRENVERYYTACIEKTVREKDLSIYQHPEFLFDVNIEKNGTYIKTEIATGSKFDIDIKNIKDIAADSQKTSYEQIGNTDKYVSSFKLERSFSVMTREARRHYDKDLKDIHLYLHKCCHEMISKDSGYSSVYVSFPVLGTRSSNQLDKFKVCKRDTNNTPLQGIGACFIYFELKNNSDIDKKLNNLVFRISETIRFLSANYTFNLGLQLQENARQEAIKSAKAAIMSRNMSHNLGSHVMSYLKQHLGSVKDMLNDRILSLLFDSEDDMLNKLNDEIRKEIQSCDKVALPFLVGVGHFISYLQERQDFIATIATDFIPYYSNVNFKDFIYDELNPDKRYERHKDRANLRIDNILLGNIARSEGLGRPTSPTQKTQVSDCDLNDIVIKFRDFDGNQVEGVDKNNKSIDTEDPHIQMMARSLDEMRSYEISLPGGVVGRQAIFSIIENVIRNAAKHGNWRDLEKLELTFDVYTKEDIEGSCHKPSDNDNANGLTLYDVLKKDYVNASDSDDLYFVTLTDNLICDVDKLEKLCKEIDTGNYLNKKNKMDEANKGIKEMKISASWLRSIKDEDIVKAEGRAPILRARLSYGHLQYIFCLVRPKKVAIVSSEFEKGMVYNKAEFKKASWSAFTPDEFLAPSTNKSYEFILLDDESDEVRYNEIRAKVSSRLFRFSEVCGKDEFPSRECFLEQIKGKFSSKAENLLILLYRILSGYSDSDGKLIAIHDGKALTKNGDGSVETIVSITASGEIIHPYVYRTHYESEKEFNTVINELKEGGAYHGNKFIEGVTGNNSTDRLVRQEAITDLWSYKHLHAMKEKIAIFDERIFSKVYGKEETDFSIGLDDVKSYYVSYFKEHNPEIEGMDNELYEVLCDDIDACKTIDELDDLITSVEQDYCIDVNLNNPIVRSNSYIGTAYAQKGIYIFTLIQDRLRQGCFNLCGLRWDAENDIHSTLEREEIGKDDKDNPIYKSYAQCEVLATFTWDNQQNLLKIEKHVGAKTLENNYRGIFDKISIHQGLLDKLYEGFGIKSMSNIELQQKMKDELTKGLYEYFSRFHNKFSVDLEGKNVKVTDEKNLLQRWYLPGMSIHSGRSKPSKVDMPQVLPFIQYASIEHAVSDCKYTLVELLDFARYE